MSSFEENRSTSSILEKMSVSTDRFEEKLGKKKKGPEPWSTQIDQKRYEEKLSRTFFRSYMILP